MFVHRPAERRSSRGPPRQVFLDRWRPLTPKAGGFRLLSQSQTFSSWFSLERRERPLCRSVNWRQIRNATEGVPYRSWSLRHLTRKADFIVQRHLAVKRRFEPRRIAGPSVKKRLAAEGIERHGNFRNVFQVIRERSIEVGE